MGYKQTRAFNKALGGSTKGFCLRNTRQGYSIGPKYINATQAWNNTEQHANRSVPAGVDVPLFYYYKVLGINQGHINVRLANGTVWSDGQIFSSLASYEAQKAPTFLGWGELVNGVRVIEQISNPTPTPSKMPPVGSRVRFSDSRTAFVAGTTKVTGTLPPDTRIVRGYDPKYPNRILVNSASIGQGVAVALYFTNSVRIPGWSVV